MSTNGSAKTPLKGLIDQDDSGTTFFRLLRFSHIFAAAVRDVLESKLIREASPLPLTLSQFHLLKLMSYNGRHQVGELAEFLGVSPPAATKNLDKLERLKLVTRSQSKGDRRATLLAVTQKGRRLVKKYEELKVARLSPVLENFEPGEIEAFSEMLERFSVSLLGREKSKRGFCLRCDAYIDSDCPVGLVRGGCPYKTARNHDRAIAAAPETTS